MLDHPAAGWRISRFHARDRAGCIAIFSACVSEFHWLDGHQPPPRAFERSAAGLVTYVARVAQAGPVGFVTLMQASGYVSYLLTDPDWRLCGIGRGLLQVARAAASRPLDLDVDAQNHHARQAYRALGFAEVARGEADGRELVRLRGP